MTGVFIDDVVCLRATDKALLCDVFGEEMWIPRSQILDSSDVCEEGDTGLLHITEWFSELKGLD